MRPCPPSRGPGPPGPAGRSGRGRRDRGGRGPRARGPGPTVRPCPRPPLTRALRVARHSEETPRPPGPAPSLIRLKNKVNKSRALFRVVSLPRFRQKEAFPVVTSGTTVMASRRKRIDVPVGDAGSIPGDSASPAEWLCSTVRRLFVSKPLRCGLESAPHTHTLTPYHSTRIHTPHTHTCAHTLSLSHTHTPPYPLPNPPHRPTPHTHTHTSFPPTHTRTWPDTYCSLLVRRFLPVEIRTHRASLSTLVLHELHSPVHTRTQTFSTRTQTFSTRTQTFSTRTQTFSTRTQTCSTCTQTFSTHTQTFSTRTQMFSTRTQTFSTRTQMCSTHT